jgi:hypothetical protein
MPVSLEEIASISGAVAAEENPSVERITIASTSAEAHRVELLVIIGRYPFEQRRHLLNLRRKDPAAFERQLRAKLNEIGRQSGPTLGRT